MLNLDITYYKMEMYEDRETNATIALRFNECWNILKEAFFFYLEQLSVLFVFTFEFMTEKSVEYKYMNAVSVINLRDVWFEVKCPCKLN